MVRNHLVHVCVRVTAVTAAAAGAVGWACFHRGPGMGVGSSHGCFPLPCFVHRLEGNSLWCLGCCWGPGGAQIACEEGLKQQRHTEESQQGSLLHTRHSDLSLLLLLPCSK